MMNGDKTRQKDFQAEIEGEKWARNNRKKKARSGGWQNVVTNRTNHLWENGKSDGKTQGNSFFLCVSHSSLCASFFFLALSYTCFHTLLDAHPLFFLLVLVVIECVRCWVWVVANESSDGNNNSDTKGWRGKKQKKGCVAVMIGFWWHPFPPSSLSHTPCLCAPKSTIPWSNTERKEAPNQAQAQVQEEEKRRQTKVVALAFLSHFLLSPLSLSLSPVSLPLCYFFFAHCLRTSTCTNPSPPRTPPCHRSFPLLLL